MEPQFMSRYSKLPSRVYVKRLYDLFTACVGVTRHKHIHYVLFVKANRYNPSKAVIENGSNH